MDCYCMMVRTGYEEKFKGLAAERFALADEPPRFYFFQKNMRSRSGTRFLEPLFPGYVFMETERLGADEIDMLKEVSGFYHFLYSNEAPLKLRGYDLEYFSLFRKSGEILGLSRATFDKNQRIVIVDGPLKGFEGKIIRVNRRCKRVTVEIDMFECGKKVDLCYSDAALI